MQRALFAALLAGLFAATAHAQQPPPQQPPPQQPQQGWTRPPPDAPPQVNGGVDNTGPARPQQGAPPPGGTATGPQLPAGQQVPNGAGAAGGPAANVGAPNAPQDQAPPQGGPQQTTPPPAPPPHVPLPVVVVMWPDRNVQAPVAEAIRTAVVEAIAPGARGRPTVALADATRLPPVLACNADVACIGQKLAELQAVAGVLVHATRRNRSAAIDVKVELVDPVSGAPRHEPATGQVPFAQEASPAASISSIVAPLLAALPAPPPPPPTLLVVVNVDGAQIMVDGHDLGQSPAAPQEVPPGRHNVVVSRSGWNTGNRMVNVAETGPTRTDFDLEPSSDTLAAIEHGRVHDAGGGAAYYSSASTGDSNDSVFYKQWWFWTAVGGGLAVIIAIAVGVAASGTDIGPPEGIGLPGIH